MEPTHVLEPSYVTPSPTKTDGELRPWGFWGTLGWLLLSYIIATIVIILLWLLPWMFDQKITYSYLVPFFMPCFIAPLMLTTRYRGWKVRDYFAVTTPSKRALLLTLVGLLLIFGLDTVIEYFFKEATQADVNWMLGAIQQAKAAGTLPWLWFSIVVEAPVYEELIFRGFLYRGWASSRLGPQGAIVLTSIFFGLIHFQYSWVGVFSCTIFGMIMGWLRYRTGSIFPSMLLHAANNAMVMTTVTFTAS